MNSRYVRGGAYRRLRLVAAGAVIGAAALSVLLLQLTATNVYAVSGMYITAGSSVVAQGDIVTVSLRINPSTPVTVVEGVIGFNPAQLQYVDFDAADSPFRASVQQVVSGSEVSLVRAAFDPVGVTGDVLVAHVRFKVLSSIGSSTLSLTDANAAYNGIFINPFVNGFVMTVVPASCPVGQASTSIRCTGVSATPKTGSTNIVGEPKIGYTGPQVATGVELAGGDTEPKAFGAPIVDRKLVQYTAFTVRATTANVATAYLLYGTSRDALMMRTPVTESGTSHTIVVDRGLTPGTELFYKVIATSGQTVVSSEVQSVRLKGFTMRLTIMDRGMTVLPNQTVVLLPSGRSATTDKAGVATYSGLAPGDYIVRLSKGEVNYQQHISVLPAVEADSRGIQSADEQRAAVIFDGYVHSAATQWWLLPAAGVGLLVVVGSLYVGLWRRDDAAGQFALRIRRRLATLLQNSRSEERVWSGDVSPLATDVKQDNRRFYDE